MAATLPPPREHGRGDDRTSAADYADRVRYKVYFWSWLILVGVVAAALSLCSDLTGVGLLRFRQAILLACGGYPFFGRLAWTVALALIAHACVRLCPQCAGSGIPELKLILAHAPSSGSTMSAYLSPLTLVCKLVGLACVTGAGLSVGREGPFVHISCCVAYILAPSWMRSSPRQLAAALRAAAGAGVSFTFGAPIGGLLFAAEVSVTYFRVAHLPRALICALFGLLFVSWLNNGSLAPFKATVVEPAHAISPGQTLATILLGVWCALLATAFNFLSRLLLQLREKYVQSGAAQLFAVIAIATLTAAVGSTHSPLRLLGMPANELLPALVGNVAASDWVVPAEARDVIEPGGIEGALLLLAAGLMKLLLTAFTIVLPIPCGLFIPTFISGAFIGRAWSELLNVYTGLDAKPGAYALVGAAALTGSITGTISTSVVALELTGLSAGEASPLAIACVFSIALRGLFVRSVYDVVAQQTRLPGLTLLLKRVAWHSHRGGGAGSEGANGYMAELKAADIVKRFDRAIPRVTQVCDLGSLRDAAAFCVSHHIPHIAVVERFPSRAININTVGGSGGGGSGGGPRALAAIGALSLLGLCLPFCLLRLCLCLCLAALRKERVRTLVDFVTDSVTAGPVAHNDFIFLRHFVSPLRAIGRAQLFTARNDIP
mmetsp:Transcript_22830/g.57962  ORF Transcript_22830/g.57962 Transcript_22830/m.57962 type:complete len:662 (+) Transcript_22830:40-2025(+)